jgi:hypothetical protein
LSEKPTDVAILSQQPTTVSIEKNSLINADITASQLKWIVIHTAYI